MLASAVNEDVRRFGELGYVMVRNVFGRDQIDRWRARFLQQLALEKSRLLEDGMLRYPEFREILEEPQLLAVLTQILGRPFVVTPLCSVDHNRFGHYHKDTTGLELAGNTLHQRPDYRLVVLGLYLQDNNDYGGGLMLVPGSHDKPDPYVDLLKQKHEARDKVRKSWVRTALQRLSGNRMFNSWRVPAFESVPGEVNVPTKAGDILMWDPRTVHRASPNTVGGDERPGGKVAVFYIFGANNQTTMEWVDLMKETEFGAAKSSRTIPPGGPDYIIT
jgi:hypothetical protein